MQSSCCRSSSLNTNLAVVLYLGKPFHNTILEFLGDGMKCEIGEEVDGKINELETEIIMIKFN